MAIKERKAKIDKKTGQISTVKIPLLPITWYLQFVKLLVDLEQAKIKLRVNKKIGKGAKLITSTYINKNADFRDQRGIKDIKGVKEKNLVGKRRKTNYVDVSIKIDKKAFKDIDLDFFKKMPSFLDKKQINLNTGALTNKAYFGKFRKWYEDNKHLYEDYSVRYVKNFKDLTDSDDYFTVQVPKNLSRLERANQIDMLREHHKIKREELNPAKISLLKPLGFNAYDRLFRVYLLRHHGQTWNEVAKHLTLKKAGDVLKMKDEYGKDNYKIKGVASSQRLLQNCNHLLYNLQQNIFPKTTA